MKIKEPTFLRLTLFGWYILIVIIICLYFLACTPNTRAKIWGGTITVILPKGMKLNEVTWRGNSNSLWCLIEPMDSDYVPKEKIFQEESKFGMLEGTVIFKESR